MHCYIDNLAKVAANCKMGNFISILQDATIGKGCIIGNNVVIHPGTVVGNDVRIDDNVVIGKLPMCAANSAVTEKAKLPPAKIGDDCIIGSNAIIYRGCQVGSRVLIADLATIRENVAIGDFTIIGRGVAVENCCTIGSYCKLETNVYIAAYSRLEDRCFIAPGVVTSNDNYIGRTEKRFSEYAGVTVKKGGRIGANATVLPGKVVEGDSLLAAGAVLTKNTCPKKIYAGIPAKYFRDVPIEELLENQK